MKLDIFAYFIRPQGFPVRTACLDPCTFENFFFSHLFLEDWILIFLPVCDSSIYILKVFFFFKSKAVIVNGVKFNNIFL